MGNGVVRTPEDAKRMIEEVGVDAVMIGRAALGKPLEDSSNAALFRNGRIDHRTKCSRKIETAKLHLERLINLKGEKIACREFPNMLVTI